MRFHFRTFALTALFLLLGFTTLGVAAGALYRTEFVAGGGVGDPDGGAYIDQYGKGWFEAIEVSGAVTGVAPKDAQYLVAATNSTLTAERVPTDTATVAWDAGTAGQMMANVPDAAISFAKMQAISANKLLGNDASGTAVEEITCTPFGRTLIGVADAAAGRTALGAGVGDTTGPSSSTDNALIRFDGTTGKLLQASDIIVDDSENVTGINNLKMGAATSGDTKLEIDTGAGHYTDLFFGVSSNKRWSWTKAGTSESGANAGSPLVLVAYSDAGSQIDEPITVVRAAGGLITLARPVAITGALTIPDDTVTNAKSANMAQSTIKGRATSAGTGDPTDLTATQVRTIINVADGANTIGAASSTDNALPRFDGTGGKTLQASGVIVDDSNNVSGVTSLIVAGGAGSGGTTISSLGVTSDDFGIFQSGINAGNTTLITRFDAGTWTPTVSNTVNLAATSSAHGMYSVMNNQVTWAVTLLADPTTGTLTQTSLQLSLPAGLTSNFSASNQASGGGTYDDTVNSQVVVYANAANDTLYLEWHPTGTTNLNVKVNGMYTIVP